MEDGLSVRWEGDLVDSNLSVQNSALWLPDVPDRDSLMHSGESHSNQDEPKSSQRGYSRQRSRRTSASDEELKKTEGPRRLRWHVSYGKSKSGSPRQVHLVRLVLL